jgi:hypothetical protein
MAQSLKVEDQESGSEIRMAGVTEQCIPALHLITIITWQLRDEGQDVCLLQFFSNDHPLGTERVIPVDAGPVAHKNSSGARDQVFSSSSLDLPGVDGHDGECPRSNGPDTCFVNIVGPHRPPWLIFG